MQIKSFEDLEIWKEARRLTAEIYALSMAPKFSKDFGLRDQTRRAAVSIMSNIAEGFERGGNQEFVQYLYIAKFLWRNSFSTLRSARPRIRRAENRG